MLRGGRALALPVAVYTVVIGAMVIMAFDTGHPLIAVGATVFAASDSILAVDRFVQAAALGSGGRDDHLSPGPGSDRGRSPRRHHLTGSPLLAVSQPRLVTPDGGSPTTGRHHVAMPDSRATYLSAAASFVAQVAAIPASDLTGPGLGDWDLRALVGHTSRSLVTVETYLESPPTRSRCRPRRTTTWRSPA